MGTPVFATKPDGSQVWAANSDAFGVGTPSGTRVINLRMPGQYYDAESGLFYNWNRYYNPAIGRYISSDPIGLEGGLNTFNYVMANPVMYSDPQGLQIDIVFKEGVKKVIKSSPWLPNVCGVILDEIDIWSTGTIPANECALPGSSCQNANTADEGSGKTQADNCEALLDSTLDTCASLKGAQKERCIYAAYENYKQCIKG